VTLNGNNAVNNLAIAITGSGNGVSFSDGTGLTIGSVDGVNGVSANNGAVSITANGFLTVNQSVEAGNSTVALSAAGANNTLTLPSGENVHGAGGVTLAADRMTIAGTVNSGSARTTLQPVSPGEAISLGTEDGGKLSLTQSELDQVTADVLQIGSASAGSIDVNAPISRANPTTLSLVSGANVSGVGPLNVANLSINSVGPVTLNGNNEVTTLAVAITGSGSALSFTDAHDLTVDAVSGISTANGAITLSADGMNIAGAVNSGSAQTTLVPLTAGRSIDLGTETAGKLSLTDAESDRIDANVIQIGNAGSGDLTISAPISPAHLQAPSGAFATAPVFHSILALQSGGSITEVGAGAIQVGNICIMDTSVGKTINIFGQNDFDNIAATGILIRVNDVNDFSTAFRVGDCDQQLGFDRGPAFIPSGSVLSRFNGAEQTIASSAALSGLSSVTIPAPKLDTTSFSTAALSAKDIDEILPAGSIGTLWLLLPFPPPEEEAYKVENAKWTSGRIAAVGSTAGPQTPK